MRFITYHMLDEETPVAIDLAAVVAIEAGRRRYENGEAALVFGLAMERSIVLPHDTEEAYNTAFEALVHGWKVARVRFGRADVSAF
jgi:hypothetical protein